MTASATGAPSWTDTAGRAAAAAARNWPLALALYAPSALLAVLATVPVLVGSAALARYGPWVSRLAAGDSLNVLVDLGASATATPAADPDLASVGLALPLAILLALGGVLLQGLAYTFLSGGILEQLSGRPGSFWAHCWRWTWPMLRFGILAVLVLAALGGLGGALLMALPPPPAIATLVAIAGALWLAYVNGALELGRASLVAHDDRRAARGLGRVLGLAGQPGLSRRASLLWLLLAAASTIYWGVAASALALVPATALALAIIAQQALAFLSAWLKLWRLAVAVELAPATRP